MSIKTYLIGSGLVCVSIGTAIIANSMGNAIDTFTDSAKLSHRHKLEQKQAEWKREEIIRNNTLQAKIDAQNTIWYTIQLGTPIVLVAVVGTSLWLFASWTNAEAKKANFEATQIKIDPVTRTYPMIVFKGSGNSLRIHDPNTKSTLCIEENHEMVPLLAANSTAVQMQSMAEGNQEVNHSMFMSMAKDYLQEQIQA